MKMIKVEDKTWRTLMMMKITQRYHSADEVIKKLIHKREVR